MRDVLLLLSINVYVLCEKKDFIYTGVPVTIKPRFLPCNFSAISVWIFMQQTPAEVI